MATLREMGLNPTVQTTQAPSLRSMGITPTLAPAGADQFMDQAAANSLGQLRKGFTSGRLQSDANALAADESSLRAAGRLAEADALRQRIGALQGRAATFAPAEQDVTALNWEPGRIADWAAGAVGQGTASLLEPAGAAAGLGLASRVLGFVPHPLARAGSLGLRASAPAAAGYLNYRQNKGEFYNDAVNDPALMAGKTAQEIDNAGTFHGAVAGALDTALPALAGERIAGRAGMKALRGMGTPAKIGLDLAGEGATETMQGFVKRGTLGHLNPNRDASGDANEAWNDFAGGVVGAGPLSALSHVAAAGHARLGVKDDTSSDDVSTPKNENLTQRLVRGAKKYDDEDAAEEWNGVLSGLGSKPDDDITPEVRHGALVKELSGRVEKGDALAKQHLDALNAMDPNDPVGSWVDSFAPEREAAYQYLMGDGMDHAKVIEAYRDRKLNEQGARRNPTAGLAESILKADLPDDAPPELHKAAKFLGRQFAAFADKLKGRGKFADPLAGLDMAETLVSMYGAPRAAAVLAKVATAAGVEKTPLFRQLQQNVAAAADINTRRASGRKARVEVAAQLVALIPHDKQLALREEGLDLTKASHQLSLLDLVQQFANAPGENRIQKLNARFGAEATATMLAMVAPGKVAEKEVETTKRNGGEKRGGEDTTPDESDGLGSDLDDPDDWELDGAVRNVEKNPGSKLYLTKGKHDVTSSTDEGAHPFVADKKTKNLPALSRLDDTNDGDGAPGSGPNTLEDMKAKLWEKLGGEIKRRLTPEEVAAGVKPWTSSVRQMFGPTQPGKRRPRDKRTVEGYDPNVIPAAKVRGEDKTPLGVGSYRIRTVSARQVMDDRGVSSHRRVKLMVDYLHQEGLADKNLGLIKRVRELNEKIDELRPDYKSRDKVSELKAQLRTLIAEMAEAVGFKNPGEDATLEDVANAYFDNRFLVMAEQMAEKDQLRLDLAEVKTMIRRGNDDIDYSMKHRADGGEIAIQSDMNLIRFKSKHAVNRSGQAAIRAGDLVAWVFENRNEYDKKDRDAVVRAHEYRDALMEGIGALAADGYLEELPYMLDAKGKKEVFGEGRGFPKSLKLDSMTQGDLDQSAEQRVKARIAADKSLTLRDKVKAAERGEKARQLRVERDQDKEGEVRNTDPDHLVDEGQAHTPKQKPRPAPAQASLELERDVEETPTWPALPARNAPPAQYWDAPAATPSLPQTPQNPAYDNPLGTPDRRFVVEPFGLQGDLPGMPESPAPAPSNGKPSRVPRFPIAPETVETRSDDEDRTQLDWDMPEQKPGAMPTDFTDTAQRTAPITAARDKLIVLTPTNAMAKGTILADRIWGQFRDSRQEALVGLQRLVASAERPVSPEGSQLAGGAAYAAPAALLLAPARVAQLVATSQGPAKAQALLDGLRSRVAAVLKEDTTLPQHHRVTLGRTLLGNDKLTGFTMKPLLEALAAPELARRAAAEKKAAEDKAAEAARVRAIKQKRAAKPVEVKAEPVKLRGTSAYVAKDQAKADKANKFIGRGSPASSTAQYAKDFGPAANSGEYTAADRVFVSAEGKREGRVNPDRAELDKAVAAGVTFITDDAANRERGYNIGERQIAKYLSEKGYVETKPGEWTQTKPVEVKAEPTPDHTKVLAYLASKLKLGGRNTLAEFLTKATVPQLQAASAAIDSFEDASEDRLGVGAPKWAMAKAQIEEELYERAPEDVLQEAQAKAEGVRKNEMRGPTRMLDPTLAAVAKTRSLMSMLGFRTAPPQFVSLAGKLLTDPRVDVGQFIKDSAEALSHALMEGTSGEAIRTAIDSSPAWLKERQKLVSRGFASGVGGKVARSESYRKLTERIVAGELAPTTPRERSITRTLTEAAKALVGSIKKMFGTPEFADVVREQLNALFERAGKPAEIPAGYKKVEFQEAVDADPGAAQVLAFMSKNPNTALSGSIVLAHSGAIYRNAKNMLHDLDFGWRGAKEEADTYLKSKYSGALQVADFYAKDTGTTVTTYIVPPVGATITDVTRQFGEKGKLTGYTVVKDGKVIGRKWVDKQGEQREGEAGTIIDFFTGPSEPAPTTTIPFTVDGVQHSVKALPASAIFDKKLSMGRDKDLHDFVQFAPNVGARLNEQASAATKPVTDEDIAKAKAYLKKTLGPNIAVEFSKDFDDPGAWVEAEQIIRLSTAIGPGVLTVAHHEALHAFWSTYVKNNPAVAKVLGNTFSTPDMLARLQDLLHEHPDALAAITTGPHALEERVAYGFQFWAAGLLDVDKPATTLFAKFRKFLRKVLGMVRESEVALDLITALHEGKLAEPSAAGQAIDKIMKAQTWNEDAKRRFDKQLQALYTTVAVSNDVLRGESYSATARALGRMMFTNPGDEKDGAYPPGYLNERARVIRQYTNVLYNGVKGKDGVWRGGLKKLSEKDMVAATKALQLKTPLEEIYYAPVREAVKGMRALTRRYWEYATASGLKIEYLGDDHYPRVWSLNALIEGDGKERFLAMLQSKPKYLKLIDGVLAEANKHGGKVTRDDVAAALYQNLIDKNGVDEPGLDGETADKASELLTPFFASQKERSFKWLDDEDVEPFLEKDLVGAMSRYLHQGIRAAEFAKRFGEGGVKLKELLAMKGDEWVNPDTERKENRPEHGKIAAEIEASLKAKGVTGKEAEVVLARHMEDIRNSVAAHEGSLGKDISPTARKFSSAAVAYQNLRLLPLSLFAAFGDVMGLYAQTGDAKATFDAFIQGLKDVYLRWKDAASDMPAERQKSVWEGIAEMVGAVDSHMFLEQLGKAHTSEFMTDFARKSNRWLFMANGLTAWDRSMRVSATKAAVLFLQHHASLPDKQHSKRWLAGLGLRPQDVPLDADGKLITDRHVLAATKNIELKQATQEMEALHYAIVRWVEASVLTPNAAQRPTWASDPHYAVLFHLKQFTYSFQHTILKRAFNEAQHGNMNPIGALAATVPVMMAADLIKGVVQGGGSLPAYQQSWSLGDHFMHGVDRAGVTGVWQFGLEGVTDPVSVLGPTVEQARDFVWKPTDFLHNIHNAIPGARMIHGLPSGVRV